MTLNVKMQNVEEQPTSNKQQDNRQNQETIVSRVPFVPEKFSSAHTSQLDYNLSSINQDPCIIVTTSLNLPPYFMNSNSVKSEIKTFNDLQPRFMTDSSDSDEESVSEVECFAIDQTDFDQGKQIENTKFLLASDNCEHSVDPETQARLEALLEAAGIGKLSSTDGNHLPDHEVLRRLTSSVSCAIDEAAAALTRMRTDNTSRNQNEKRSLIEACSDGDVGTVKKLLTEGRSVHETTEEGESLLSLACSAGYYELAQVLIAMNANIEDRGIKGDCTPLMEAASAGHVDIVSLLIAHGADVNAHSTSGNTPLMYACAGGHEEVVRVLLEAGANVEDHNDNGHTPLMEAASAGHVSVAKILLEHGAGINTHSNEFKESALTLACYKGHLEMVKFLLEAGADREHKTDEMHTALMEASMDGHVEVARLLLDSGAQVNMPTDSFESPLTLAACGGHVDLAMLLIERGANIEEVNDEGYTPLMEAAREGHEEMIALLLSQGANINAQTEETQETALTLACCGGFLDVTDFLIKAGADIELGASTPLMEAAQEGHLDLVRYLLETRANVHAQTQTGDTALTYACENGHTDVADLLLQFGAYLEHESEGGRTPLMKACRAGHLCTVQFLISKHADVNRQTTNNDHTPLSLACAGGHLSVVELLLAQSADPFHKLKDNSTMLIEAAKGGHTSVVQLLLDYPHSIMMNPPHNTTASIFLTQLQTTQQTTQVSTHHSQQHNTQHQQNLEVNHSQVMPSKHNSQKSLLRKNRSVTNVSDVTLTSAEAQQVRSQPPRSSIMNAIEDTNILDKNRGNFSSLSEPNISMNSSSVSSVPMNNDCRKSTRHEQILHKQQILEELQRVERELQIKGAGHLFLGSSGMNVDSVDSLIDQSEQNTALSDVTNVVNIDQTSQSAVSANGLSTNNSNDIPNDLMNYQGNNSIRSALSLYEGFQANRLYLEGFREGIKLEKRRILKEVRCLQETQLPLPLSSSVIEKFSIASNFSSNSSVSVITVPAPTAAVSNTICSSTNTAVNLTCSNASSSIGEIAGTIPSQPTITSSDVSQNTAISDRPKVKAVSKKDNKNVRKTVHGMVINKLQQQHMALVAGLSSSDFKKFLEKTRPHCIQQVHQLQQLNQQLQLQLDQAQQTSKPTIDQVDSDFTRIHREGACPFFSTAQRTKISNDEEILKLEDGTQIPIDEAVNIFESISFDDINNDDTEKLETKKIEAFVNKEQFPQQVHQVISTISNYTEPVREYFAVPVSSTSSLSSLTPVQQTIVCSENQTEMPLTLQSTPSQPLQKQMLNAFEASLSLGIQRRINDDNFQAQLLLQSNQMGFTGQSISPACSADTIEMIQTSENDDAQLSLCNTNQVQVATQTQSPVPINNAILSSEKKPICTTSSNIKGKKTRYLLAQQQSLLQSPNQNSQQTVSNFSSQNYQVDPASISNQYTTGNANGTYSSNQAVPATFSCMDVDSETDSNHDTALTLACAGGHEELVELLLSRGADIEHRDKKGFTPLILAATAGHQKVVEILLNHGADIEAQSERTKDTPLSLACSGGRYEVVELLLNRGSNKEHRNVSDYTPLSLAASGGYVNIIKLLLGHGAEINSRTGSKLGISPLMLAAMNGHTAAVKLLLDMGSDINAQIETNRNTALTLACFQGRHEVVSLLLDRKANVEHRAKTGLTPLMEAASGGYVEVGRVLLNKGADVNATPVPSSRDTALTIAADKGHCRFVELLLSKGTQVEVKNKKGNSPLWLAANGGHLNVVDLLYHAGADIDSQDNRKVSCLMAAFRKGHIKVVKWMVNHVTQFPSDQEMTRYIATVSDKELLERCQECVKIIRAAKETQAAKANKNATILLEELDMEKTREETKKAAAARRRERKKKKKLEKKEEKRKLYEENKKNEAIYDDKEVIENKIEEENFKEDSDRDDNNANERHDEHFSRHNRNIEEVDKEEGDSGIDANSQGSYCSNDTKSREKKKEKKKKKIVCNSFSSPSNNVKDPFNLTSKSTHMSPNINQGCLTASKSQEVEKHPADRDDFEATGNETYSAIKGKKHGNNLFDVDGSASSTIKLINNSSPKLCGKRDEGWKEVVRKGQTDDSGRFMNSPFRSKKVSVPPNAISRVIGRGGSNINTIRAATGAHIEVEKQSKSQGERIITIKGSMEATKQAHILIVALIKDPEVDILQMLPKSKMASITATSWDKSISSGIACKLKVAPAKLPLGIVSSGSNLQINKPNYISNLSSTTHILPLRSSSNVKLVGNSLPRATAPRLISNTEKRLISQAITSSNTKTTMSYTSAIMTAGRSTKIVTTNTSQTFAAKLSEMYTSPQINNTPAGIMQCNQTSTNFISILKQTSSPTIATVYSTNPTTQVSPQQSITNNSSNICPMVSMISTSLAASPSYPGKLIYQNNSSFTSKSSNLVANTTSSIVTSTSGINTTNSVPILSQPIILQQFRSSTPISTVVSDQYQNLSNNIPLEYSLFNDTFSKVTRQSMWGNKENETQKNINFATIAGARISVNPSAVSSNNFIHTSPVEVDASKAPGYRGTSMSSPTSNKPCSAINLCNNKASTVSSNNSSPIQPLNIQSSISYTSGHSIIKSPVSLIVARPLLTQKNVDMNVTSIAPFTGPVFHGNVDTSQNIVNNHKTCNISSISQANVDVNMFNENNPGYENQNVNSNLLKIVSHDPQASTQSILPIHQHIQNYPQTVTPSATVTTTISMSRLNPRAPDFSSSLHLNNKPQVTMFSTATPIHSNIYSTIPAQPTPAGIQTSSLALHSSFPFNKYQASSQRQTNLNIPTSGQNRWPFVPAGNYSHQDSIIGHVTFSDHLTGLGAQAGSMDIINLENGSSISPEISPSSTGQVISQEVQVEDRKVPRPIGTERTWKNYSTIIGPGGDADNMNWLINNEKHVNSWSGISPSIDRSQLYCSNTTFNRISSTDTDLHQIMETSYQGSRFGN
ncbi:PREDICTED: ankyrin repeat and KH domain-containing protein 1-like [Ceratosolen solmsi marchali]|uniref:Ankyrin repeat and KH domain-containing protein 1-like n=1 Tax=Ceratosolen solmsi marchali TaxID=326594 RepID=A0AAJ6YDW8_9HYME|nr:PREDICTED: ankyrin repeat and KH domain-containing protein 1-like [Ceratosolen solmsi marchali]